MAQTSAHILMVDDEEEIRHVVRVLLESEGFTVTEAASGEEALARFTPDMDLVILDVKMPGIWAIRCACACGSAGTSPFCSSRPRPRTRI